MIKTELSRSLGGLIALFLLCMDMESPCLFTGRLVHHREKLPVSVPRLPWHFLSSVAMHRAARHLTSLPVFSAIILFFLILTTLVPLVLVLICISLMKVDLENHLNVTATAFLMLSAFEGRKSVLADIFGSTQ